jgi:hypothetical protein
VKLSAAFFAFVPLVCAQTSLSCKYSAVDVPLGLDPQSSFWKDAPVVSFQHDSFGRDTGLKPTEVRVRWSKQYLYVLYVGRYETLSLKPEPQLEKDTVPLWDWDVVELFIGSDFDNIQRYREFEVSPQGEWVDLDIRKDLNQYDWHWNSAFQPAARIDRDAKIWYGGMKIPWTSIDLKRPLQAGLEFRVNFYRIEGPPPNRKFLAWQPTKSASYHTPEAFGSLILSK